MIHIHFKKMEEFVGFILVLKWLLFTGGKLTCAGYNASIYLLANRTASYVCEAQSLYCQQKEHILVSQITFYTVNGCKFCGCNGSLTTFNMDPTDFKYELYDKCSFRSQCNFSSTVQITSQNGRFWLAVVEYKCIHSELSKDMCSYLKEPYEKNLLYLELSHRSGIHYTSDCTCLVPENSSIVVVHYRSSCEGNLFVNGIAEFEWVANRSIFNYSMNNPDIKTKVTIYPWQCTPELLWIRILKPINSTLCCNCDRNSTETNATTASLSTAIGLLTSEHITSSSTSEGESTIFYSSTLEMTSIERTYSSSSESTQDITPNIASQKPKEITSDSSEVSSSVIIGGGSGGIAFVILVVAVVCVVIKRKRSVKTRAGRGNEAYKNAYYNEKTTVAPVTNGVNLSYEDQTMHGDRELLHRNGDADVNEYTDPFDVSTSQPGASETEKAPKDITNKSNNMYEEPYNGPTVPESRSLSVTYAKPLKLVESPLVKSEHRENYLNNKNLTDASEYSHLAANSHPKFDDAPENQYNHIHDIDNTSEDQYNHIHDVDNTSEDEYNHIDNAYLTKVKDNYSHVLLKSTKHGTDKQQSSSSVEQYNHLEMHVFNNSTSSDEEKDNHSLHNYYNVDITDHDHVALREL